MTIDDNNDWIFQDDWLSCMCAHYQQALLDGDTDNAIGLRLLLDELKIPAEVISAIEAFAASQLTPSPNLIAEEILTEALSPEDLSLESTAEVVMETQPVDPIMEAVSEAPVQFAAMDVFPDTLVGILPNPSGETQPEPESDPLTPQKLVKPAKKPKPDKTQLSLF